MKKRGFTLIEMLIVIVIIGILAGALIPRIGSAREKANDTARKANLQGVATAIIQYTVDGHTLSGNAGDCGTLEAFFEDELANYQYSRQLLPKDPAGDGIIKSGNTVRVDGTDYLFCRLDGSHFAIISTISQSGGNVMMADLLSGSNSFSTMSEKVLTGGGDAYMYIQ